MPDAWNPEQYERFRAERSRPFYDLLALVRPCAGARAIDLGCGTGELTRALHERLGCASTVGIDSSEAMLARAEAHAAPPALTFARRDVAGLAEGWGREPEARFDLVFSNAALHWVPGHEALLEAIARAIAPGGQLAVQVPANHDRPTHTVAAALAREPEFRDLLGGHLAGQNVLPPEAYATCLHDLGYVEQHVRLVVYPHVLPSREHVLEWVRGTLLTDYEARLPGPAFASFLARYSERLMAALPDQRPFFYPFKRILFWGRRA